MSIKQSNKALGTGLISAFAASLCCITPLVAMAMLIVVPSCRGPPYRWRG